ncbi:hypothetical protein OG21DRAFT_1528201, partial [Imleria badia]
MNNAHMEVFHKTLAFFCALSKKGCAFSSANDFPESSDTIEQENDPLLVAEELPMNNCRHKAHKCHGQLKLRYDNYNQLYIQCSQQPQDSENVHLLLHNLRSSTHHISVCYLCATVVGVKSGSQSDVSELIRALLSESGDLDHCLAPSWAVAEFDSWYLCIENHAKSLGIGPLASCMFAASPKEQKANCPYWHHDKNNKLHYSILCQSLQKWHRILWYALLSAFQLLPLTFLLQAKRISIDMSFKCVRGWHKFEIEGWDNFHQRSMVLARTFTTSQSADAHVILFRCIFSIVEQDTGVPVKNFHIHVHFKWNIQPLKHNVSHNVIEAMYSISSAEPHKDFEATLTKIRCDGARARSWLKDKETANINCNGIGLTLLAGIMRGQQHDMCMISGVDLHISHRINMRDRLSTHTFCAIRTITQTAHVQQRQHDMRKTNQKGTQKNQRTQSTTIVLKNTNEPIKVSTYSTLNSALDINIHGKSEPMMSIDMTAMIPQTLTIYDPQYHCHLQCASWSTGLRVTRDSDELREREEEGTRDGDMAAIKGTQVHGDDGSQGKRV